MLTGIFIFALSYAWLKPLLFATSGVDRQTLPQLMGLPAWLVVMILIILAAIGFLFGSWFEKRGGGPLSSQQLDQEE